MFGWFNRKRREQEAKAAADAEVELQNLIEQRKREAEERRQLARSMAVSRPPLETRRDDDVVPIALAGAAFMTVVAASTYTPPETPASTCDEPTRSSNNYDSTPSYSSYDSGSSSSDFGGASCGGAGE